MRYVQPIRDKNMINDMKNELLKVSLRNYMIFNVGINTGLRISDILALKVKDVKNKTHINLKERKTSKSTRILINKNLKKDLNKYIKNMSDEQYLFKSQKGNNRPISRIQAYRILNDAANMLNLDEVGTHTLRKTFGYWHYNTYKDIAILQEIFNHSAPSITLRYVGITDDLKDKTIENFYL